MARTLLDKLWDAHVVTPLDGGRDLLYIDLHLIHEVTTPQAFEGLRLAGRREERPLLAGGRVDLGHSAADEPRSEEAPGLGVERHPLRHGHR